MKTLTLAGFATLALVGAACSEAPAENTETPTITTASDDGFNLPTYGDEVQPASDDGFNLATPASQPAASNDGFNLPVAPVDDVPVFEVPETTELPIEAPADEEEDDIIRLDP